MIVFNHNQIKAPEFKKIFRYCQQNKCGMIQIYTKDGIWLEANNEFDNELLEKCLDYHKNRYVVEIEKNENNQKIFD